MSVYSLCLLALMKSSRWDNINSGAGAGPPPAPPSITSDPPRDGQPQPVSALPVPGSDAQGSRGVPKFAPIGSRILPCSPQALPVPVPVPLGGDGWGPRGGMGTEGTQGTQGMDGDPAP